MEFERAFWPHDRQHVFLEAACGHAAGLLFNYVPATGRPVLVAMPVVESATWVGQADEAELRRFYTEHLRRAFGRKATAPVRVLKTDWGGDLFSGMSYSYIRVGSGKAVMEALGGGGIVMRWPAWFTPLHTQTSPASPHPPAPSKC